MGALLSLIKKIFNQMLQFLSEFTTAGIVHRDIKPENLAFTEDKNIHPLIIVHQKGADGLFGTKMLHFILQ